MSVFPSEIEAIIGHHSGVIGCGVIGIPDEERGERPIAFVQLDAASRGQLTEKELQQWCERQMAIYKAPLIKFIDKLPLTTTGKVKKQALQALL
ncbi:hypothetical protein SPD89_12750 [Pseudogracilibacillus sp. SO30301A]